MKTTYKTCEICLETGGVYRPKSKENICSKCLAKRRLRNVFFCLVIGLFVYVVYNFTQ
jgi:hypothetical protein